MKLSRILPFFLVGLVLLALLVFFFNPAEKARQSRDAQRASDLEKLAKAIDFYITKNAKEIKDSPNLLCTKCSETKEVFGYREFSIGGNQAQAIKSTYVNGHGWVPVDISLNMKINETPIRELPLDPLENGYLVRTKFPLISSFYEDTEQFSYTFTPGRAGKYKLTAKMESKVGLDKAKNDGGSLDDRLEIGSDLELAP